MDFSFLLLAPIVGFLCVNQLNKLKAATKPTDGVKLTYLSSIFGLFAFLLTYPLSLYIISKLNKCFLSYNLINDESRTIVIIAVALLFSFLISLILAGRDKQYHGDSNLAVTLYNFINEGLVIIIFLKNGKAYVGRLGPSDISDNLPFEERTITLSVYLSGTRDTSGILNLNLAYSENIVHYFFISEIVNFSIYSENATFEVIKKNPNNKSIIVFP